MFKVLSALQLNLKQIRYITYLNIKTIRSFQSLALNTLGVDNNKIVRNSNSRTDKMNKILAKFKILKNCQISKFLQKPDILKQLIFLSSKTSNVFFIKNNFD